MQLSDVQVSVQHVVGEKGWHVALVCRRDRKHGLITTATGLTMQDLIDICVGHISDHHPDELYDCCVCCQLQPKSHEITGYDQHLIPCLECHG